MNPLHAKAERQLAASSMGNSKGAARKAARKKKLEENEMRRSMPVTSSTPWQPEKQPVSKSMRPPPPDFSKSGKSKSRSSKKPNKYQMEEDFQLEDLPSIPVDAKPKPKPRYIPADHVPKQSMCVWLQPAYLFSWLVQPKRKRTDDFVRFGDSATTKSCMLWPKNENALGNNYLAFVPEHEWS